MLMMLTAISFAFIFGGCGGGGGDGGDGAAAETFNTVDFFPLTSGWQTDKWTVFVDLVEHDVNGVMTKAMVDTRGPYVYFWTCDDNGLILHAEIDEDGLMYFPSAPVVFMDRTSKVGDKKEGTFEIFGVEVNYSVEVAAKEDVFVPAGRFADSLKITVLLYPSTDLPSQYGKETFWLAKGVGFVKGTNDQDSISELFTDSGETRELLSYHITPSELSGDELEVREAWKEMREYSVDAMDGDMVPLMSMISGDYYDRRCRDKPALEESWGNFFANISDYKEFTTFEDVEIIGDDAYVLRESLSFSVDDASGEHDWDWSRQLRRFKRESDEWKYYGAQLGFGPDWYSVYVRHTSYDGERYAIDSDFIDCADGEYIDTTDPIAAFTISGPPGSGLVNLDLMPYWYSEPDDPWRGFWNTESLTVGASGFYTFRVENNTGDYFVYTDYLEAAPHMALPVLVSPVDGEVVSVGNVILDWDPVDQAETYRVDMRYSDDGGATWNGMPNIYTDDTQATVSVNPETLYEWRVRARQFGLYGGRDNESRSDWKEFATYDVFTIGGYLQYRTRSDASNEYRGWLEFTKNNNPIDVSDITLIELKDGTGNPVPINDPTFYADSSFWGGWNDTTSSVDFSGPHYSSGFSIGFPAETNLPAGNYTYEAITSIGDLLTLTRNFPGETILPVVDAASMNYEWLIDGGLRLTWSVPASGAYDQLRIVLMDQDWSDLLYVRLPVDKEELTIPGGWIQQMTNFKNPSAAIWLIQTRSYMADGNNYARGYSDVVNIPWGIDITPLTVDPVTSPTNLSSQILTGTKDANSSIWINGAEVMALDAETIWSASVTLTVEGTNDFSITSKDAAGNQSAGITVAIVYDATPPTNPEVTITVNPDKTVTISWSASSDSSGILEYRVTRDTVSVARTTGISYSDMGVEPGSIVDYCTMAVDNAGNISDCTLQAANIPPGGTGIFNTQFQLAWPTGVGTIQDLKVADIDGDGNRDIVAFSKTWGEDRYVLLAWGPISAGSTFFGTEMTTAYSGPPNLLVDTDGDSRPEIVGPGPRVLKWDDISESWTEIVQLWTDVNVYYSAFGDMDVDGILDMFGVKLVGDSMANEFETLIYRGIGDGTFDSEGILATGITSDNWGDVSNIRISDMNRDGTADVIFWDDTNLSIFSGQGSGTYMLTNTLPVISNKYFRANYLVGDISGDGFPDLIYDDVPGSPRDLNVFLNDGKGYFPDPVVATGIGNSWEFATGDLNGDAIPDLVVEKDGQFLDMWWSASDGTFTAGPGFSVSYFDKVATTDIDRDGDVDVLAYGSPGGASDDAEIIVLLNE